MRKAVLLVLALCLASPPLAAIKNRTQKTTLTLHALASPAVPHEKTTPWTGAYSNTSCAGSGMYGGYSSPLDVNCRALPAPPQAIPITIGRLVVQGQLEGDGKVYTVACTAHWVGSGCGWLTWQPIQGRGEGHNHVDQCLPWWRYWKANPSQTSDFGRSAPCTDLDIRETPATLCRGLPTPWMWLSPRV